ncbi:ribonuclease H-like domain-containing protein [Tanacetum coccineum]
MNYGKYGPQPQSPSPIESDASSTVYSTCQSNDSDGEQGTVSDHSVNDDPIPIPSIEQVTIATQKTQPQVPKPQQTVDPSCAQHVKTPRQPIRTPVTPSPIPSHNRQNWNQRMERELVCMLISGSQFKSQHVSSGSVYVNSVTHFKSAASRVNTGKRYINSGCVHINTARVNRPMFNKPNPKPSQVKFNSKNKYFSKQSSPANRPFSRNTAYRSNIYAVKGKMGTAVKTSAGCVWRKAIPLSNTNSGPTPDSNVNDHPLKHMEHRGIFDSGCSGHMTGNRAHLEDYQELSKVGSVTFGGSKGSISGKGTIRLGNLVFDDVAFVKELGHFNLFSISQICDKKLNVLFTEKECFVVSSDFKLPDANQVLLKVPRQHNMYTFDMKTVDSSKGYTCLLAKASSNEAKLWHRRLGHLNFKNLNKLVKDNLVRGLPSKSFKNDHTCVACQKGKQHKASCKAKVDC